MKNIFRILPIAILSVTLFAFTTAGEPETYPTIEIGAEIPSADTKMDDITGEAYSLNDIKEENGLLVIFTCNTCPFVIYWEDRYDGLRKFCEANDVGYVLVNPNEAKRDDADSPENMKKHAEEKAYHSLYVVDENSEVANAFGAKTTPHVFLFNGDSELDYKGAIDDNYKDMNSVQETYLMDALQAMVGDEKIETTTTKPVGCSIKRVKS